MESFLPRLFWSAQQEFQLVLLIQVMVIKLDFVFFCSFFPPVFFQLFGLWENVGYENKVKFLVIITMV
jgi:hypothetical protein